MDRRKPGQSRFTTQRQEPDQVQIVSGWFEGHTTGTPLAMVVKNVDQRSKDYGDIAVKYRPGHADYTYDAKYGIRDSSRRRALQRARDRHAGCRRCGRTQGSGRWHHDPGRRSRRSGRIAWIATNGTGPRSKTTRSGAPTRKWPEPGNRFSMVCARQGSSAGAVIEIVASGVPAGLGSPIYGKIDSDLARAMMTHQRRQRCGDRRWLRLGCSARRNCRR